MTDTLIRPRVSSGLMTWISAQAERRPVSPFTLRHDGASRMIGGVFTSAFSYDSFWLLNQTSLGASGRPTGRNQCRLTAPQRTTGISGSTVSSTVSKRSVTIGCRLQIGWSSFCLRCSTGLAPASLQISCGFRKVLMLRSPELGLASRYWREKSAPQHGR